MRWWVLAGLVSCAGIVTAQDASFSGPVYYGHNRATCGAVAAAPTVFSSRNCYQPTRATAMPVITPAPVAYAPAAPAPVATAPIAPISTVATYPAAAPIGNGWVASPGGTVRTAYTPVSIPITTAQIVPTPYFVGNAMFGQPKLFAPNQPIRNFFRYIAP